MSARRLAVNRLRERLPVDAAAIDRFIERHGSPDRRGRAGHLPLPRARPTRCWVRHRVVGLPDPLPLRRIEDTDLWAATTVLPEGSRVEYQLEIRRGEHHERFNDPLNPRLAHSPMGSSSVLRGDRLPRARVGRTTTPRPAPGELVERAGLRSKALRREQPVQLYLPARFNRAMRYPLLDRARRHRLPQLRRDEDRARQPHPPPRHRAAWSWPSSRRATGSRSTRTTRRTPGSSPASSCRTLTERAAPASTPPTARCLMGSQLRRRRLALDGRALPRRLRLAAPAVGVAGLHRHRHRARRRSGLRPGGEVRQPLPRAADARSSSGSS